MNKFNVSIIVTTYNRHDYLLKTIEAILNQTYREFELIVIDNYSDYDFLKLMYSFIDSRIKPFQNNNNGIIAVNRNFGIVKSQGDLLAFCDDDDLWLPDKLQIQVNFLMRNPELLLVGANAITIPDEKPNMLLLVRDKKVTFSNLLESNKFVYSSVIIRKSVVDNIGLLDENPIILAMEDYDYWLRILAFKENSGFVVKKPLVWYRVHSYNVSSPDKDNFKYYNKLLYIFLKHSKRISSKQLDYIGNNLSYLNRLISLKKMYYRGQVSRAAILSNKNIWLVDKIRILVKKQLIYGFKLISKIW